MLKFGSSSRSFVSRNRVSFLSFIALVGFIGLSFFAFSTHSQSNEKAVSAKGIEAAIPVTSPSPTPTPHDLVGSFYTLQNGINSKLMLNNKGPVPLEVSPTLYNSAGQALELAPVTVEAHSARYINLSEWAAVGGESFQTGSIKLFHVGKDLVLGAQIYLENEANSLSYEEKLAELGKFDSRRQEAVWLQPTGQTTTKIVLSNTSDAPLTVRGRLAKAPRLTGVVNTFQLAAHETRLLDLRADFTDGRNFAETELVGLSFEHAGANDALQTRAMVADVERGYSNVVQFANPAGGKSSEYQAVGFQIDEINNEQFAPLIVARNIGSATATIAAKVPYTRTNGTFNTVTLPPAVLRAGEIKLLDTRRLVQKAQQEQIKIASLEITYNTAPGSVIVAAQSVGVNGSLVLRPPMWDPFAQRSPTGGYPWRIEETSTTKTYIKNITDREQSYVAYLFWENGGQYMLGRKKVAAHQTVEIDVKDLRDSQVADEFGRTIPLYMTSGQLHWTLRGQSNPQLPPSEKARETLALLGRTEQIDFVKGISSNYACQNCCQATASGEVFPDNIEGEAGSQIQFIATEYGTDCYGTYYTDVLAPGEADWSSSDNDVATVNSYGLATLIGAGDVDIEAEWEVKRTSDQGGYCPGPFFTSPPLFDEPSVDEKKVSEKDTLEKEDSDDPTPNRPDCNVCSAYFEEENAEGDLSVRPRIRINRNGTPVPPNTNQNVIVGQQMNLSATVTGGTPTSHQWTIPGTRVANYEVTCSIDPDGNCNPTNAVDTPLTDLSNSSVNYYWIDGADARQVRYTVTIRGRQYSGIANFNVKRPTAQISASTGTVQLTTFPDGYGLWFGNLTTRGIKFTRTVTMPANFDGDLQWVQTWNKFRRINIRGRWYRSVGEGLDSLYPYETGESAEDSPGIAFGGGWREVEINDSFKMWLMFKPTGVSEPTIWVPLRTVNWGFSGKAVLTGTIWQLSNPNPSQPINPPDADSIIHPRWIQNPAAIDYLPE